MRAAIYTRISRDRSGERAGVGRQEADCRAFCERRGWEVAGVYADNDLSAYSGKPRPAYKRLLADIEGGRVGAVVAWHNDRLHRSPAELEGFIALIEAKGTTVAMVEGGDYDLTTADGRLSARIVGAVARKESEDKQRRARRKQLQLAESGLPGGGPRPFGFEIIRPWGWKVHDREAELVREAVDRVLNQRHPLRSICADWSRRGITTVNGHRWEQTGLKRVLTSARMAGLRSHAGRELPASWPAIIDVDTLAELRATLWDPARTRNGGVVARKYLLAGMIYCSLCGSRAHARPRADKVRRYTCISGPNFNGCGKVGIVAEPMEELVVLHGLTRVSLGDFSAALHEAAGEAEGARALAGQLRAYEDRLTGLETAHYVEGVVDVLAYRRIRADLESRIAATSTTLAAATGARLFTGMSCGLSDLFEAWRANDLTWRRELLARLIERVTIKPASVRGRNIFEPERVVITWASAG
jgi:site-specific DNA recombinase